MLIVAVTARVYVICFSCLNFSVWLLTFPSSSSSLFFFSFLRSLLSDCIILPYFANEKIDLDKWSLTEDPSTSQSQFKKGLIEILKKPYDPQEHKDLWDEASRRRPKEKERNLRRKTKSCPLENSFCKSYIDQYSG